MPAAGEEVLKKCANSWQPICNSLHLRVIFLLFSRLTNQKSNPKIHERTIYKVCYLYTHPNAPLNDLYQDVVLNLWKAYPKFRKECKISTWIYRIALNTCISFYRKEKNVPEIISLTKDIDRTIEAHDPINEMLKQLYQMINQLGQLDKSIILLYLEDKSYEEIAEITGLTVTNIATKLSRIKDKLKRMKKEE